jgi:hypothetical protein
MTNPFRKLALALLVAVTAGAMALPAFAADRDHGGSDRRGGGEREHIWRGQDRYDRDDWRGDRDHRPYVYYPAPRAYVAPVYTVAPQPYFAPPAVLSFTIPLVFR